METSYYLDKFIAGGLVALMCSLPISIAASSACWVFLLICWLAKIILVRPYKFVRTEIDIPVIVFLGISVIAAISGIDPKNSLLALKQTALISLFYIMVNNVSDEAQMRKLLRIFIITSLLAASVGVLQYIVGIKAVERQITVIPYQFMEHWPKKILSLLSLNNGRAMGTRSHPLTYAEGIMQALIVSFSIFLARRSAKSNLKWGLVVIIMILSLIFSNSRGPWMMTGLCLLLVGMFRFRKFLVITLVAVVTVSIWFVGVKPLLKGERNSIKNRFETIPHWQQDRDIVERTLMWQSGLKMFIDHPLLGIGMNNINQIYPAYRSKKATHTNENELHSNIVQIVVERGLLGLLAYLWLMLAFLTVMIKCYRSLPLAEFILKSIVLGGILSFMSFHLAGISEVTFGDSEVISILYAIMGLMYVIRLQRKSVINTMV